MRKSCHQQGCYLMHSPWFVPSITPATRMSNVTLPSSLATIHPCKHFFLKATFYWLRIGCLWNLFLKGHSWDLVEYLWDLWNPSESLPRPFWPGVHTVPFWEPWTSLGLFNPSGTFNVLFGFFWDPWSRLKPFWNPWIHLKSLDPPETLLGLLRSSLGPSGTLEPVWNLWTLLGPFWNPWNP